MNSEEKELLLTKDYCNIINTLNKIILKMIKKNEVNDDLRKKDYKYFKEKIKKSDNYFFRLMEMVINYFLSQINTDDFKKYFKLKNEMYSEYNYDDIPTNYIKASEIIDEIIESYACIEKLNNIYEDADNIAEEIINAKLGITDSFEGDIFTLDIIEKFSKFNNITNEERYEILWYILLYIAIYYNILNNFK